MRDRVCLSLSRPSLSMISGVVVSLFLISPRSADADVGQVIPVTPRAMALGGAYTALADDASALYYNPAGLVRSDGSYIGLAFLLSFPSLGAVGVGGESIDVENPREYAYGLHLAWSPKSVLEGNLGLGFSVLLPHRRALRFEVHRFEDPYFALYENSIQLLEIRVGAAYELFDLVSVGASMLLLGGLNGKVDLVAPFQSPDEVDPSQRTIVATDAVLPNREFFTAGVQVYPMEGLTLGLSYREATFVPIELPIDFTVQILGLTPIRTVAALDVKVKYSPPQLNLGGAYRLTPEILVTGDLSFALYAKYEIPYGNVTLTENPNFTLLPPRVPRTSLRNVWIPRIGVEWSATDALTLRAGYYFFRSFIRSTDAPILDSDKHNFAIGASYALGALFLPEGSELNVTASTQMLLYSDRTTTFLDHSGRVFSTAFGAEFRY